MWLMLLSFFFTKNDQPDSISSYGFSIIEALVTLAIIAILLAMGGSYLIANLDDYRMNAAIRDLITTMQKARMTAVRNNADVAVIFDPGNGTYSMCTDAVDGDWSTSGDNVCPITVRLESYGSGVAYGHGSATQPIGSSFGADEISYTANRVVFSPRGTAKHAGYAYVENEMGKTGAVGTITIGTILSKKWNGSSWIAY
jgi:type IV fimbrial biogenesis protein FimT